MIGQGNACHNSNKYQVSQVDGEKLLCNYTYVHQ